MSLKGIFVAIAALLALGALAVSPALAADPQPTRYAGALRVTAVSAPSISAVNQEGQTVTVQTTSDTVFWLAGAVAKLTDVSPGERIRVRGQLLQPGVVKAERVRILPVTRAGQVTAVSGSTITIDWRHGGTARPQAVLTNDSTVFRPVRAGVSLKNVVVGERIRATGYLDAQGNLAARHLIIRPSRVGGIVKSVQGNAIAVERQVNGQAQVSTVLVTDSTRYLKARAKAALADVVVGSRIAALGYRDQSGGLTAAAVRIAGG